MSTPCHRFSAEDRRQQILNVSRGLFASKGFNGTTTREIACSAGVNEALIFRHFPTKEELYWAVIDDTCRAADGVSAMENSLASGREAKEVFAEIAEAMLERREKDPTLMRLLLYSALEKHELTKRFFSTFVGQYYEKLSRYIARQIHDGLFRTTDPILASRAFLGMVIYHSLVENLFSRDERNSNRKVAETITDIWLRGMWAEGIAERLPDAGSKGKSSKREPGKPAK